MKSRTKWPPHGFQVLHAETGMKEPFSGSFQEAVDFEFNFRKRNPALAQQNGWTLDVGEIEQYVDQYNAARMISGGWYDFVDTDPLPQPEVFGFTQKKTLVGAVADRLKGARAASGTIQEMFGNEGVVDRNVAESRAAICVSCPGNDRKKTLYNWFVTSIASQIEKAYELLRGINITTSLDEQLGVCEACECPMKLKVNAKISHIRNHMPKDVPDKLRGKNQNCWILTEP